MNFPAAMRYLLWKDMRSVLPALTGCVAIIASIQILSLVAVLIGSSSISKRGPANLLLLTLVAPTLAAMACTGVLIGQERQDRSWSWSSSLPLRWQWALTSKFLVWLIGSLAMSGILLIVFGACLGIAQYTGRLQAGSRWLDADYIAMTWVIALEAFVFFGIAALLFSDTLWAMVATAIAMGLGHLVLIDLITENTRQRTAAWISLSLTGVLLIGFAGLASIFRWRWTDGQLYMIFAWRMAPRRMPIGALSKLWSQFAQVARPRSEFGMLLVHAMRSCLTLRLTIVAAAVLVCALEPSSVEMATSLAALLLGFTTVSNDQTLDRYRFFSDRGCRWFQFLVAHFLVAFSGLLVIWISNGLLYGNLHKHYSAPWIYLLFFGLGLLTSLCVRGLMAVVTGLLLAILVTIAFASASQAWAAMMISPLGHMAGVEGREMVRWCLFLSLFVLTPAVLWQAKRWMTLERRPATRFVLVVLLATLVLPIVAYTSLAFLAVPNVAWQGLAKPDFSFVEVPMVATRLPGLIHPSRNYLYGPDIANVHSQLKDAYRESLDHPGGFGDGAKSAGRRNVIEVASVELQTLETELEKPFVSGQYDLGRDTNFGNAIQDTAFLAVLATRERKLDVAVRAWKANRKLLDYSRSTNGLLVRFAKEWRVTLCLWQLLTDEEVTLIEAQCALDQLRPTPVSDDLWKDAFKARASEIRWHLTEMSPLRLYPPIQWRMERILSLQLAQDLRLVESLGTARTMRQTDNLPERLPPSLGRTDYLLNMAIGIQILQRELASIDERRNLRRETPVEPTTGLGDKE